MIKRYNQYIKEHVNELDPFNEEDWGYDDLPPVLRVAKEQNIPYDQITEFSCSIKQLTNLEGIEKLINLKYLYCSTNQLTNLKEIENLVNLEDIWCFHNQLTSLEGIENLVNLKRLVCSFNLLTNLDEIENLVNLERIDCNANQFSNEYKKYMREYCRKKNIKLAI